MTRHRWLLIESHPAVFGGGAVMDGDEYVVAEYSVKRNAVREARRLNNETQSSSLGWRVMSAQDWNNR